MQVLVVGGTGFVSRHTVAELLRRGHGVTILHRGRTPNPFGKEVRELLGDRQDEASVRRALEGLRVDAVLDLAYAWDRGTGPREVASIIQALPSAPERYVYLSSASVYGGADPPFTEDSPRRTQWLGYGENKVATEDYLFGEDRAGRVSVAVVRPPYVYGPYDRIPREGWFWDRILADRPVIVPDDGTTLTHMAPVRDVAWALAECAENSAARGQAFNVAEADPITQAAYVDRLAGTAGRSVEQVFIPRARIRELGGNPFGSPLYFGSSFDVGLGFAVSIDKVRRILGFHPTDPRLALAEAFDWYLREDRGTRHPTFSFDKLILGR